MNIADQIQPDHYALFVLITGTLFALFWFLDSVVHGKLAHKEITEKELQTHRNILLASVLMEASLLLFYWWPMIALPLFIALFITRTAHEFIDELHWHTDRCTPYESMLHLGMWISVLSNTAALFTWGFFTRYKGLEELHPVYFIWAGLTAIALFFIGLREWKR